jgi:hypothetical protein
VSDTTTDDTTNEIPDDATPRAKERIIALAAERTALRQQLDAVGPKLAEVTTLQAQLSAATETHLKAAAEWAAKETAWQTDRALLAAGITDPEAADIIAHAYSRVTPAEGADKPSLATWLQDRAALPKGVQAYLPAPAATTTTPTATTTKTEPAKVAPPNANAGAGSSAPLNGPLSAAEITEMMRTPEGIERYKKVRAAHLSGLRA